MIKRKNFYETIFGKPDANLAEQEQNKVIKQAVKEAKRKQESEIENFIYVPEANLYFARERTHLGKSWNDTHELLKQEKLYIPNVGQRNLRMPTLPEIVKSLNYFKTNEPEMFEELTAVRDPWRVNHIDAYFEKRQNGFYVLTQNKTKAEKLDEDTLTKDRAPGISLDEWLKNPTSQGLPKSDISDGDFYYLFPRDGAVARLGADSGWACLNCNWDPDNVGSSLGVFAVAPHES